MAYVETRTRNESITVIIAGGDMFEGSISQWEDTFGYISDLTDPEAIGYIKEWAYANGHTFQMKV